MKHNQANSQDKEYVTTHEAAELLNVSVRTVQNWVKNGILKAWRTVGGHNRIKRKVIERMVEQQNKSVK